MSYATDDAEMSSAREILYLCRGKFLGEIRQEISSSQSDAHRLADLEGMVDQLRDDIRAVQAGDRAVITRARVLYGTTRTRMVRTGSALTGCLIAASFLPHRCLTMHHRCTIVAATSHHPCITPRPAGPRDRF